MAQVNQRLDASIRNRTKSDGSQNAALDALVEDVKELDSSLDDQNSEIADIQRNLSSVSVAVKDSGIQ